MLELSCLAWRSSPRLILPPRPAPTPPSLGGHGARRPTTGRLRPIAPSARRALSRHPVQRTPLLVRSSLDWMPPGPGRTRREARRPLGWWGKIGSGGRQPAACSTSSAARVPSGPLGGLVARERLGRRCGGPLGGPGAAMGKTWPRWLSLMSSMSVLQSALDGTLSTFICLKGSARAAPLWS